MDTYEKKYKKALEKAKESYHRFEGKTIHYDLVKLDLEDMFPELKESEDERMKNQIINYFECQSRDEPSRKDIHNKWINYIKRKTLSKNDYAFLRDCARILKTFGYCSHANKLFNLCPELGESIKEMMSAPIVSEEIEDERIRKHLLKHFQNKTKQEWNGMPTKNIIAWFVKQGEHKESTCVAEIIDRLSKKEQDILFKELELQKEQKPVEWTEKDKVKLFNIKTALYDYYTKGNAEELMDWIKNHKPTIDETSYQAGIKRVLDNPESYGLVRKEDGGRFYNMLQWTGNNLKEVVDFTGKSPKFDEWFKTWEDFENYVHSHNNIFKIFNEDGSHYEVPVGAWIVRTPDGYNVPSKGIFKQKPAWSEDDEEELERLLNVLHANLYESFDNWLKSLKDRVHSQDKWMPSDEQIKELEFFIPYVTKCSVVLQKSKDTLLSLLSDLKKLKEE